MQTFELSAGNTLTYAHQPPGAPQGVTFVFFNALTGNAAMWSGAIASRLHGAGHGTLVYNMRGQADTRYAADVVLDAQLASADAVALLGALAPQRPLYVGLSIGGLFAARAHLQGAPCVGMALINTLRRDGPRLQWINTAVSNAAALGGPALVMDLLAPMLFDEPWLSANRQAALDPARYQPLDPGSGVHRLLASAGAADWNVPWEALDVPVLVLTGQRDRVFYEEADVAALSARLPRATRVDLADAGHMVPLEQPDTFVAALLDLAGHCQPS